jgi:hypothetical protein
MINQFFTTLFTIKRMAYTANKATLTTAGTFSGHLQQIVQERVSALAGAYKVSHSIWCDPSVSVNLGDVLESGAKKYIVQAVQYNDHLGGNKHLEILVKQ